MNLWCMYRALEFKLESSCYLIVSRLKSAFSLSYIFCFTYTLQACFSTRLDLDKFQIGSGAACHFTTESTDDCCATLRKFVPIRTPGNIVAAEHNVETYVDIVEIVELQTLR